MDTGVLQRKSLTSLEFDKNVMTGRDIGLFEKQLVITHKQIGRFKNSTRGAGTSGDYIKRLFCVQVQMQIMPSYLKIVIFVLISTSVPSKPTTAV